MIRARFSDKHIGVSQKKSFYKEIQSHPLPKWKKKAHIGK